VLFVCDSHGHGRAEAKQQRNTGATPPPSIEHILSLVSWKHSRPLGLWGMVAVLFIRITALSPFEAGTRGG
jgi:hypothetical protein